MDVAYQLVVVVKTRLNSYMVAADALIWRILRLGYLSILVFGS